jgi:hypothetical protein
MNQDMDIQAQREDEHDRAYYAYITYRDMGAERTMLNAYRKYNSETGRKGGRESNRVPSSPSRHFDSWAKKFNWKERIRDWDNKKRAMLEAAQSEADRQSYIKRIEDSRAILEETASMGLKAAQLSLAIGYSQLQKLGKESANKVLNKPELDRLATITRNNKDSIDVLAVAKTEIYDALGIIQMVQDWNAKDETV